MQSFLVSSCKSIAASLISKQDHISCFPNCDAPADQVLPSPDDLLKECALAVAGKKWQRFFELIYFVRQRASPDGDSLERVTVQFAESLAAAVTGLLCRESGAASRQLECMSQKLVTDAELQAAFLSFNQVTPFVRFTHLTANQAILEALQGWDAVHIVDMEIMQGVQWPPLLQALAARPDGPPRIRITGVGSNALILKQTGNRLTMFAASIGLAAFEFRAVCTERADIGGIFTQSMPFKRAGEALAINMSCISQPNQRMLNQSWFLTAVRSLQPTILTLADRELNYKQVSLTERLMEVVGHYHALFESLEATLPPSSAERTNVERVWFRSEIMSLFPASEAEAEADHSHRDHEGSISMEWQRLKWRDAVRNQGFSPVAHSAFAVSQARLLLRLHYPSPGYQLMIKEEDDDCLFLGWRGTPLFGVTAWRM